MSWMDSWSRPTKGQATPAPYYLLPGGEATPYCHSCGRVIGARRANAEKATGTPVKYCSSRCRSHKPGKLDRDIEAAFVRLLNGQGQEEAGAKDGKGNVASTKSNGHNLKDNKMKSKQKGDQRILVPCSAVEKMLFDHQEEVHGSEGSKSDEKGDDRDEPRSSLDAQSTSYETAHSGAGSLADPVADRDATPYVDGDVLARMSIRSGTRKRPPQSISEVNGSVGGEKGRAERIEETAEMLEKRRDGQRRAKEREMVRCAARRGVAFGFAVEEKAERKKCEAVMLGKVVESSFVRAIGAYDGGNLYSRWTDKLRVTGNKRVVVPLVLAKQGLQWTL